MKGLWQWLLRRLTSVRFALTLWYVGSFAAILSIFGWVLYNRVAHHTYQEVDRILVAQAQHLEDTFKAFWEATSATNPVAEGNWQTAPSTSLRGEVARGRLPTLLKEWARETGYFKEEWRTVRLLDRDGQVLASSQAFSDWNFPVSSFAVARALAGHSGFRTVQTAAGDIRLFSRPVKDSRGVLFVIQSARSIAQATVALERLRLLLFWLIASLLLVTSVIGWFLATLALQSVGEMRRQVERVSHTSLEERLTVPQSGDELQRLAETFNAMLERLERAFRRLRQFSAAASHELRTPLAVMRAELELALRKPRSAEEYQRVLSTHLGAVSDLTSIVEILLTLARTERAQSTLEQKPIELCRLVREQCARFAVLAVENQIKLNAQAKTMAWVRGERRLLERLFGNLVDNAMHYTPPGGAITVVVQLRGRTVDLVVSDTGVGIARRDLPHIFDRFFSRRQSRSEPGSTGLGLGICRWIAEAHGGKILVYSEEGKGSTFTVRLPTIEAPEVEETHATEAVAAPKTGGPQIPPPGISGQRTAGVAL